MVVGLVFKNGGYWYWVVIGKDICLLGYMLENVFVVGFILVGMDVFLFGFLLILVVVMFICFLCIDFGVMIFVFYNLFQDNGIKFFGFDGFKFSDEIEKFIENFVEGDLILRFVGMWEFGWVMCIEGVQECYIELVKCILLCKMSLEGLCVVVDCVNGVVYKVVLNVLFELGVEVIFMGVIFDGYNINKDCGFMFMDVFFKKVYEVWVDIGIVFDGDVDWVIIVDENGIEVDGDQLMVVVVQFWQVSGRLVVFGIVVIVMFNFGFEWYFGDFGFGFVCMKVGDCYVVEYMCVYGYNVGGE